MKRFLLLTTLVVGFSAFAGTIQKSLTPARQKTHFKNHVQSKISNETRGSSGSIDFTYAGDPYYAFYVEDDVLVPGKSRIYMMFEMSADDIKACAGNEVTGFSVYSPTDNYFINPISDGIFFYSTTGENADYTQDFKFKDGGFDINDIELDTPYKITGDEEVLYFGYSLIVPERDDVYYVVTDANPSENSNTCMYGLSNDESFPTSFESIGEYEGALCMAVKITGDNLPKNIAKFIYIESPRYIPLSGEGANLNYAIRNCGANTISSMEIVISVDDMPDVVQTIAFPIDIEYKENVYITANGIKAKESGYPLIKLQITKVNGVDFTSAPIYAMAPAYDEGFEMKVVAEDATGTWCGWCPGGIEVLEYLKTTYPDRVIPIGVHCDDPMQVEEYLTFLNYNVEGYPTILYNRLISQNPSYDYSELCVNTDDIIQAWNIPSYGKVDLTGTANEEGTQISLTAKTKFSLSTEFPHFLSFIIVEDGVGPYRQANYYGEAGIPMNGWEEKPRTVLTTFDDVARYTSEYPGIEGSLPEVIEENTEYEYSIDIPLLSEDGTPMVTNDNYRVIAIVTNLFDGRIVNACQIPMSNKLNDIQKIADNSGIIIRGGVGKILVEGIDSYEVYTMTGCRVTNKDLIPAIYIVTAGNKTEKVIVK